MGANIGFRVHLFLFDVQIFHKEVSGADGSCLGNYINLKRGAD
jgi:hypothetical protein